MNEAPLQVSDKIGDAILVSRGEGASAVVDGLTALREAYTAERAIGRAASIAEPIAAPAAPSYPVPYANAAPTPGNGWGAPAAPPSADAPSCPHGPRKLSPPRDSKFGGRVVAADCPIEECRTQWLDADTLRKPAFRS